MSSPAPSYSSTDSNKYSREKGKFLTISRDLPEITSKDSLSEKVEGKLWDVLTTPERCQVALKIELGEVIVKEFVNIVR